MKPSRDIGRLLEIMAALRTPGTGCPWDLEQNFATIAPYTLEEAYEVADAIARGDLADLREELGDLLLQVVFHARMAQEQGAFDFGDVVEAITDEADPPASACVRRGARAVARGGRRALGPHQGRGKGRARRPRGGGPRGEPARSPACRSAMPALTRALKLQAKAGKVGFDWNDPLAVLSQIREECDEIEAEIAAGRPRQGRGRGRRPAVCRGQSRAPSRCRSGGDAARRQPEIRAALCLDRAGAGGAGQAAAGCDAGRNGRALGRGQSRREARRPRSSRIPRPPPSDIAGRRNAPAAAAAAASMPPSPMKAITCASPAMLISPCFGMTPRSGSK